MDSRARSFAMIERPFVLALLGLACSRDPSGVIEASIEDPAAYWFAGDFVRLEPAIRFPSPAAELQQVEVWMALPEGAEVVGVTGDDGAVRLRFGVGTRADRIEYVGEGDARRIVDVRGSQLDAHGRCTHHVLRPIDERPGGVLVGMQWPCDELPAQREATTRMRAQIAGLPPLSRLDAEPRMDALDRFAEQNQCDDCHREARPDAARTGDERVWRGTDANGFFVPSTLLRDAVPLEGYGAFDRNADDVAVAIDCGSAEPVSTLSQLGARRWRCPDDRVPIARFDWAAARSDDPERVAEICRSRRWLWEHLDAAARAAFPTALDPC